MKAPLPIAADDLWVKVVEMLQQTWAAIEADGDGVCVYFISDASQVFDRMPFAGAAEAQAALARNGFRRFRDAADLQRVLSPPTPPFTEGRHFNGPIYSSERFWR